MSARQHGRIAWRLQSRGTNKTKCYHEPVIWYPRDRRDCKCAISMTRKLIVPVWSEVASPTPIRLVSGWQVHAAWQMRRSFMSRMRLRQISLPIWRLMRRGITRTLGKAIFYIVFCSRPITPRSLPKIDLQFYHHPRQRGSSAVLTEKEDRELSWSRFVAILGARIEETFMS